MLLRGRHILLILSTSKHFASKHLSISVIQPTSQRVITSMEKLAGEKITLPNGISYEQPTGLFIDNSFVKPSKTEDKIEVTDPALVILMTG